MDYGVHFTDMAEEFVAEAFALGCAFNEAGYIAEFNGRIYGFF